MRKKQMFKEEDIPSKYIKEIKNWSGAFNFVTGRIDEFNTLVSVWEHGGVYKIIRVFIISGKNKLVVSVDCDMMNATNTMSKLLMRY